MDFGDLPFFLARTFSAISHAMAQPRCPTWYLDDHLTMRGEVRKWYLQLLVSCWTYLELKLDGIGWLKINEHNSNLQLGAELTPHPDKVFPHFCVQYQDDEGHLGPTFRFHMYICIYLHGWNLYFIINKVILWYLSLLTTIPVTSQWGPTPLHPNSSTISVGKIPKWSNYFIRNFPCSGRFSQTAKRVTIDMS